MMNLQRFLFSFVLLVVCSVTSATPDQFWNSAESTDLDESGERINPVHKPLMNFLITSKDLQKAGIPVSSEEKRFGFAPMRGKRFYNDLDFPIVRNNKRARFFGLRGKRVPSLEQKLSDEDFKNILGKLLNDAYDFSTNSNDADSSLEKRFRFTALRG
uniref:Uncharacterized protein LOC111101576 n=1 Tax=Crassostrea virginica TaxID=6565 RepID=A0A8B8AH12_CRAVI|nr:uncharacterized protein LOC111101576 [Crassostrea virginica]XP_022292873.1 uncharacterized protein LOC111103719 [Crassostrea virginica]